MYNSTPPPQPDYEAKRSADLDAVLSVIKKLAMASFCDRYLWNSIPVCNFDTGEEGTNDDALIFTTTIGKDEIRAFAACAAGSGVKIHNIVNDGLPYSYKVDVRFQCLYDLVHLFKIFGYVEARPREFKDEVPHEIDALISWANQFPEDPTILAKVSKF